MIRFSSTLQHYLIITEVLNFLDSFHFENTLNVLAMICVNSADIILTIVMHCSHRKAANKTQYHLPPTNE